MTNTNYSSLKLTTYEGKQTSSGRRADSALHTHTHTHTQLLAQQPKWGIHNSIVDYSNLTTSPLPTTPNPDYTQNAVWDNSGDLVLYEADGIIYNKNGGLILDMTVEAANIYPNSPTIVAGFTEFIFVPVPGECNQYYGITTYSNGGGNNPITDVVWCKIDLNPYSGLGSAIVLSGSNLKIDKESISCVTREAQITSRPEYVMHIEVTQENIDGNRYLFASNSTCVSVLDVTSTGISFVDGYQVLGRTFAENLRSEMEVFQVENTYQVALPGYFSSVGSIHGVDHLSVFNFDMSGTSPIIGHYDIYIPGDEYRFVRGIEFSDDGLTLYASIMTLGAGFLNQVSGNNIVYFSRNATGDPFSYSGAITSGTATEDFGIGMIEKGKDGKLWFAGNERLGNLLDNNIPNPSTFNENALVSSNLNQLTIASNYGNNVPVNPAEHLDLWQRKMYLLVDQIDGEDYSFWSSVPDIYPPTVSVTCFPYTFPYSIPPNANINYSGNMTWNFPTLELQSYGSPITIQFFNEYGCEHKENITVLYEEELWCDDAEFSRLVTEGVEPQVVVSSLCDYPGTTQHEYYLYESNGQGGWILIDSCFSASCTLTGLYNGQTFKIVHDLYNNGSTCNPFVTKTHQFTIF